MSIYEVSTKVDQLASAWEEFKSLNNQRLNEIEKKGIADPITDLQLNKLNQQLDEYKAKIDQLETAVARPEYNQATSIPNNDHHTKAFNLYLRKGVTNNLDNLEYKSLTSVRDKEGRFLVTPHLSQQILSAISLSSPMRKLASIETISTDSLEIIEQNDMATAGWAGEEEERGETNTPTFGKNRILVHELYAQPKATQKLIDDAEINIENWLANKISESFIAKENEAFIHGDGQGKPKGILAYEKGNEWGKIEQIQTDRISVDTLLIALYSLKDQYAKKASFLMHRTTLLALRTLKDGNGNYIWQPAISQADPSTLLGLPVVECEEMPVYDQGKTLIALGDFKQAYKIVDRAGIQMLRDPYTDKPFVKFYATKRVGGAVVNYDAIKLLKLMDK